MKYRYESHGQIYEISIERFEGSYRATLGASEPEGEPQVFDFEILDDQPGALSLRIGSQTATVYWASEPDAARGRRWLSMDGCAYQLDRPLSTRLRREADQAAAGGLRAPMPAQVRGIDVEVGAYVHKGQTLIILEAMKMEMRLQSPRAGRVSRLAVQVGDRVNRDQVLVEIEE